MVAAQVKAVQQVVVLMHVGVHVVVQCQSAVVVALLNWHLVLGQRVDIAFHVCLAWDVK